MSNLRPEGFSWVSPYIIVADVDAAIEFYKKAFGFTTREILHKDENGNTSHAEMFYKDQSMMFGREGGYGGPSKSPKNSGIASPISIYLYTENVDDFYKNATAAGAQSIAPPEDMFWADRMCVLSDLDGYIWSFATHLGEAALQKHKQEKQHSNA